MKRLYRIILALSLTTGMFIAARLQPAPAVVRAEPAPQSTGMSIFRNPVVPGAVISGYFDHDPAGSSVTFYNGYHNTSPAYGFYFSCTSPNMWDFVGCMDPVSGVNACAPERQLWYDNHHGTDYEYSPNWYTGDQCNPSSFEGITHPVYAPTKGLVFMAGYDPNRPANGWHIRMKHDLNGNGNWDDDNFRSVYLHFTANALSVYPGQIVEEGQYLGLGGSTGYSSSPHLHFEVQRSADYFQTTYWPVDPFGWQGDGRDPWGYTNEALWQRAPVEYTNWTYVTTIMKNDTACGDCGATQLIQNGGFESSSDHWNTQGVDTIVRVGAPNLRITPYKGDWLGWLGGRNNALDSLSQDFQIPPGNPYATFQYFVRMDTAETNSAVFDFMFVNLRDSNGNVIRQLDQIDNTFASPSQWVARRVDMTDLYPLENQPLRISFEAVTDGNTITSFYIDEVSWIAGPAQ